MSPIAAAAGGEAAARGVRPAHPGPGPLPRAGPGAPGAVTSGIKHVTGVCRAG